MATPKIIKALKAQGQIVTRQGTILTNLGSPDDTEYWHNVGDSGEVGFGAGWSNYAGGTNPCSFRRDDSGFVHLRGMAQASGAPSGVIFTLPESWCPVKLTELAVPYTSSSATANGEMGNLFVHPWENGGNVELQWYGAQTIFWLGLDNLKWRAY